MSDASPPDTQIVVTDQPMPGPQGRRGTLLIGRYDTSGDLPAIDGTNVLLNDAAYVADVGELWYATAQGWKPIDRIRGLDGTIGPMGPQGSDGKDGIGIKGDQGERGPAGKDGINGKDGAIGPQGPTGSAGKDGQSIVGPAGPQGIPGTSPNIRHGRVAIPNILVQLTGDVTITFATPFADASYTLVATVEAGTMGIVAVESISARTRFGASVRVKNVGIGTGNGTLHYQATHD